MSDTRAVADRLGEALEAILPHLPSGPMWTAARDEAEDALADWRNLDHIPGDESDIQATLDAADERRAAARRKDPSQ